MNAEQRWRIALSLLLWVSLSISASLFDETKALAVQGDAAASNNSGVMYKWRGGTPQDYKKAFRWYEAAAEPGYARAQFNLGNSYYDGQGTPQDYKLAHMWFNIAAASGYEGAAKTRDILAELMT